jgi:hypothetical protein
VNVAVPENGGGGATVAVENRRSNLKSERGAIIEVQRKIEIGPLFSVALAAKLTDCRWRPIAAAAKPNSL